LWDEICAKEFFEILQELWDPFILKRDSLDNSFIGLDVEHCKTKIKWKDISEIKFFKGKWFQKHDYHLYQEKHENNKYRFVVYGEWVGYIFWLGCDKEFPRMDLIFKIKVLGFVYHSRKNHCLDLVW
jgi:hypothetical protein